jgi:hypothetical protein
MDIVHDDAKDVVCEGSGTPGFVNLSLGENGKSFRYYKCGTCGAFLPYTPLKAHLPINRIHGNR